MSTTTGTRASARLGLTLRQVLLEPDAGFEAAAKMAARRERAGLRPVEGRMPWVVSALEGAALMAVWLKLGGLMGLRDVPAATFRWGNLAAALVLGALLGLAALALWGRVGPFILDLLHGATTRRDCRVVWGASALPQGLTVLLLLPLDIVLVGPRVFTTENLGDPLATAWAAFSIAISLGLVVWTAVLFVRGTRVTVSLSSGRAVTAAGAALLCIGAPGVLLFVALDQIAGRWS